MGWSHGGMIAQQFAFTYPDSLSKLILFDTAAYFGEFLSDVAAAVKEFKDQPWFEDSFAALQDEWAGNYQTDEDMAALWVREMKFYFKHFGPREAAYHERTKHLPVRIAPLKIFNEREAPTMDLRPHLKNVKVADARHRRAARLHHHRGNGRRNGKAHSRRPPGNLRRLRPLCRHRRTGEVLPGDQAVRKQ